MAVIPYLPADIEEPQTLVTSIRARRGGKLLNLDRMLLHSPALAAGWNTYLGAVRNSLSVPAQLREVAICAVAVLNNANYEFIQHAPEYIQAGGTEAQLAALQSLDSEDFDMAGFTANEQVVISLCLEMTRSIQVSQTTIQKLRQTLANDQSIVEMVGIIATYNMVSRFLVALGIEPE